MKLCHVSDNHSVFYPLEGDYEIIIHSGDMLPNNRPRLKSQEPLFQRDWIRDNSENFKRWIGNKPFLFCSGNHEYTEPCTELRDMGINAINIDNKIVELNGFKFYAFPYVPYIGVWNWEAIERDMKNKVDVLIDVLNKNDIDVLVAHCPPYGILDMNNRGSNIGNLPMLEALKNNITKFPKLYLCGHVHEANGYDELIINNKILKISNAATSYRIIEI
jgi:Icc-related predicted phosphoesterase